MVEEFSPEDKLFMLYLMTNPHTTQLGIYSLNKKIMAFELGYSVDAISVLIDRFETKYDIIRFSQQTNEIALKNSLRHSIVKGGKPVEDLLLKEIKQVKNKSLLKFVYDGIVNDDNLNKTVEAILVKIKNDYEKDNDNDNDNDVSLPFKERIVNESLDVEKISEEYGNIKAQILDNKENGDKVCEWCGCKTTILHRHHHPIPKRLGGTETVNICSNCHHEFHAKEGEEFGSRHSDLTETEKPYKTIVDYLNEKANTGYKSNSKNTVKHINARLKEGYTVEDFKTVIDKKCAEWKNTEMEQYLRPETLFGTKFEGYLNAKISKKGGGNVDTNNKDNETNQYAKWITSGTVL